MATLLTSLFILSYINRIVERPMFKEVKSWSYVSVINNIYEIIVTMTTVGYGDFVPFTWMGKTTAAVTALWGGFIISLMIVSVNGVFTLSIKQKTAFEKLTRVRYAVKTIISAMRLHVAQRKMLKQELMSSTTSRLTLTHNDIDKLKLKFHKNLKKFIDISSNVRSIKEKNDTNIKINHEIEDMNYRFNK